MIYKENGAREEEEEEKESESESESGKKRDWKKISSFEYLRPKIQGEVERETREFKEVTRNTTNLMI